MSNIVVNQVGGLLNNYQAFHAVVTTLDALVFRTPGTTSAGRTILWTPLYRPIFRMLWIFLNRTNCMYSYPSTHFFPFFTARHDLLLIFYIGLRHQVCLGLFFLLVHIGDHWLCWSRQLWKWKAAVRRPAVNIHLAKYWALSCMLLPFQLVLLT